MKIAWAAFGERNGGHALLATSSGAQIAAKITQFTDRPGDPPAGVEWGPVISGFYFLDHYILLRTLPDPTAGRAGMVRTYAAFVPAAELGGVASLATVFDALPSDLTKPPSTLPELEVDGSAVPMQPTNEQLPGFAHIVEQLCSPNPVMPLVWARKESYLPIIDAIWQRLPIGLRPCFGFSFQFVPEHKLPVAPTIIATLPGLEARWPARYVIPVRQKSPAEMNLAQKWFTGVVNGADFSDILHNYGMTIREFKELNVLSSFADLVTRLPRLSLAEARKAVRILEKYSRPEGASRKKRIMLFDRLCELVLESSVEDIETLRNFDSKALADLIPSLQDTMRKWTGSFGSASSSKKIKLLEMAIATPESWWSIPLIEWVRKLATSVPASDGKVWETIFASAKLTDFAVADIPRERAAEEKLLAGLPANLSKKQSENISKLSRQRGWMRLDAASWLRALPKSEAITAHASTVTNSVEGFDLLYRELGLAPLVQAACNSDTPVLDRYVARLLASKYADLPANLVAACARWQKLLSQAVAHCAGPIHDPLRTAVIDALATQPSESEGGRSLSAACWENDTSVFFAVNDVSRLLKELDATARGQALSRLNQFVHSEIAAGRTIQIRDVGGFEKILDASSILNALRVVPVRDAAKTGVAVFRNLPFLADSQCREWLIGLFTRTQSNYLDREIASEIGSLLVSRDYPLSANMVRDTVENYGRRDIAPIWDLIRPKYPLSGEPKFQAKKKSRLPKVLVATALELERREVIQHLGNVRYDSDLYVDVGYWPTDEPMFEVWVLATGAGNLDAQRGTLRVLAHVKPKLAFFVGVAGGIKDSNVGDVVYSTKVYYIEGGKEEANEVKSRPDAEHTTEALVQLARRVAESDWQPVDQIARKPKATPAVFASGERVLASTSSTAMTYQRIKAAFNDTQVIDMEGFGFLAAVRHSDVRYRMIIRGVSDEIEGKAASDTKGNQSLAARNAAAFLFRLLHSCSNLIAKQRKKLLGFFSA